MSCENPSLDGLYMPIFIPKSPENPAVSWADLGWQRPGLDFLHGDRGCIHPATSRVQKLEFNGFQWSDLLRKMIITRFILVYIICISLSIWMQWNIGEREGLHTWMIWGCMGYTLFVRRCHPSKIFNTLQRPHHSGSDFAQVLQNESPIFWNSTHTRPEFIKHPDRSCVVRLLGMERAKELPLALRTHKSQNLWVIPWIVYMTTLTMASSVASHWGSLRIAGYQRTAPRRDLQTNDSEDQIAFW